MSKLPAAIFVVSILGLGACTTAGGTPATAPPITDPPVPPVTPAPSIATAPTTTTTVDRLAEIEAIFQDLEVRRLQAIMDNDEEAFRAVFANEEYGQRSMVLMSEVRVINAGSVVMDVTGVISDSTECIAVEAVVDASESIVGGGIGEPSIHVLQRLDGDWGISWVGSGWVCDGPHPFSG